MVVAWVEPAVPDPGVLPPAALWAWWGAILGGLVLSRAGTAAAQIVNAGTAFIDKPKSFTLKLVAPKGLGLPEVAGAAEPKDMLNFMTVTATANQ